MANHPISMVSPIQIIQASMASNSNKFAPSNSTALPSTGEGESSTASEGTSAASVSVTPGTVASDSYAMQASDSTAFVFGSTAANQSAASNQYTTVDDTTKSANEAAMVNGQVMSGLVRTEQKRKSLKKKRAEDLNENETDEEEPSLPQASENAKRTLTWAMEHGIEMV